MQTCSKISTVVQLRRRPHTSWILSTNIAANKSERETICICIDMVITTAPITWQYWGFPVTLLSRNSIFSTEKAAVAAAVGKFVGKFLHPSNLRFQFLARRLRSKPESLNRKSFRHGLVNGYGQS